MEKLIYLFTEVIDKWILHLYLTFLTTQITEQIIYASIHPYSNQFVKFCAIFVSKSWAKAKTRTPKLWINWTVLNSTVLYMYIYSFLKMPHLCVFANSERRRPPRNSEHLWKGCGGGRGGNIICLEVDEPQSPASPQPHHPTRCLWSINLYFLSHTRFPIQYSCHWL